jgi:hypothetical protein
MSITAQLARASPLAAIFERHHVGWETRDPDLIASFHSEDTVFWLRDGSEPVTAGMRCAGTASIGLAATRRSESSEDVADLAPVRRGGKAPP